MKTIRYTNRGSEVTTAQTLLNAKGFNCGAVDGIFGDKTEKATKDFQKAYGLCADGVIGKNTWAALLAVQEPSSPHFKLSEFRCKDGTKVPPHLYSNVQALMNELEKVRAYFGGKPITIVSGYRTLAYNRKIGNKTDNSQHIQANAADIKVKGVSPSKVYAYLDKQYPNQGVGKYATFTHLDLRGRRGRW